MNDIDYATQDQMEAALRVARVSDERTVRDALRKLYFAVRMMHGTEVEQGARLREQTRGKMMGSDA